MSTGSQDSSELLELVLGLVLQLDLLVLVLVMEFLELRVELDGYLVWN